MNTDKFTFTAVDFETANNNPSSVCQIGIARVENGIITQTYEQLIFPPDNLYLYYNTRVHKLTSADTKNSPTFDQVWDDIKHFFENQTIVAHNVYFDAKCLQNVLAYYNLKIPKFERVCTYKIYKQGLNKLADQYNLELKHHNALSDAITCAKLYLIHLQNETK